MAGPADAYGYKPNVETIQQGFDLYRKNADEFIQGNKDNAINQAMKANTDPNTGQLNEQAFLQAVRQIDANKALEYQKYFEDRAQQKQTFQTQQDNAKQTLKYNQLIYDDMVHKRNLGDADLVSQRLANAKSPAEIPGILDMIEKMGVDVSKWRAMPQSQATLDNIRQTTYTYQEALKAEQAKNLAEAQALGRLMVAQTQGANRLDVVQAQGDNRLQNTQLQNEGKTGVANINADVKRDSTNAFRERTQAMVQNYQNNYDVGLQKVAQAKESNRLKGIQIQNTNDYQMGKINQQNAFSLLGRLGNLSDPSQIDGALNVLQAAGVNVDNLRNLPKDANTLSILQDVGLEQKDKLAADAKAKGLELRTAELDQRERFGRIAQAKDAAEFSLKSNQEVHDIDKEAQAFRSEAMSQKSNFENVTKAVDSILADPLLMEFFSMPYQERTLSDNGVYKYVTSGKYANLWSKIEQLNSLKFLELAQRMKGLGPMSDLDAKNIQAGFGQIKPEVDARRVSEILSGILKSASSGLNNLNTDYTAYVNLLNQNRNDILQNLQSYTNPEARLNLQQSPPVNTNAQAQTQTSLPIGSANVSGQQAPNQTFLGSASASGVQQPAQSANSTIIGSQLEQDKRMR